MSEHIFEASIGGPKIGYKSFEFIAHYAYTPAEKGSRSEPDIEEEFEITDITCYTAMPSLLESQIAVCLWSDIVENGQADELIKDIKQSAGL